MLFGVVLAGCEKLDSGLWLASDAKRKSAEAQNPLFAVKLD
jgi:hypothetical protein